MLKRFLNTARLRLFLNACRNIFNRTNSHQFLTSLACLLGVSSMVDMYTIFRLMVAICFACLVVSYFLYLSLQPFYPQQSTTSAAVVVNKETPHNSGLYSSSKSVDELNPHTYKIMAEGKNPSIILYYASWCGHCRYVIVVLLRVHSHTLTCFVVNIFEIEISSVRIIHWQRRPTTEY